MVDQYCFACTGWFCFCIYIQIQEIKKRMIFLLYIYLAAAVVYILFIFFCWIGWRRLPKQRLIKYNPSISVSVIVPARNENDSILNCLEDLADQDYPAAMYEVIVVDDHS